jgi:hypothetical protein
MTLGQIKPAALAEQMTGLRLVIQNTRAALQATRYEFAPGTLEGLSQSCNTAICWR